MIWLTGHPGYRRLNRFADGELGEAERLRVAEHLEGCPRCRGDVAFILRAGEVARSLRPPAASERILDGALTRRRAGERVLLPLDDMGGGSPALRPHRVGLALTAAALLVLALTSLFFTTRRLEADRTGLRITPARPEAGERLSVEYRGGERFADAGHLRLRARYRSAGLGSWQGVAAVLARGDDGVFRGELELADSAVYAAFAVEDLEGARLDSRNRRLWDVLVHDRGRPTLAALGARVDDLVHRDWGAAYAAAVEMTELHPDAARAWMQRLALERQLGATDSLLASYRLRYPGLERSLLAGPHEPDDLAWLAGLAVTLGDLPAAERVLAAVPDGRPSPLLLRSQALVKAVRTGGEPAPLLRELSELAERAGPLPPEVIRMGLGVAAEAGDPVELGRWANLYLETREDWPIVSYLARSLGQLDPELLRRVERHHRRLLDPAVEARRPLWLSSTEYARWTRSALQRALTPLAELARDRGDDDRATALALEATPLGWDTPSLERLGGVLLSLGDTAAAAIAFARAAADPAAAPVPAAIAERDGWALAVDAASDALAEFVLAGSVIRPLDPAALAERGGSTVALAELIRDRPAVVAFTFRHPTPALLDRRTLESLRTWTTAAGARLLVVSLGETGAPDDSGAGASGSGPASGGADAIVRDPGGELQASFHASGTPDFFVVDARGRVRFEHTTPELIPRQLELLRRRPASAATVAD